MSTVSTRCTEQCATIFVIRSKIFLFDTSIYGGRTGKREVSTVLTHSPEQCASIFVFWSKNFFFKISISGKGRCQRCQSGALNIMRHFCLPVQSFFLQYLNFCVGCTYEMEMPTVPKRGPKHYATFLFFGPKFFSSISQFLELVQVIGKCQRCQRGTMNSMR